MRFAIEHRSRNPSAVDGSCVGRNSWRRTNREAVTPSPVERTLSHVGWGRMRQLPRINFVTRCIGRKASLSHPGGLVVPTKIDPEIGVAVPHPVADPSRCPAIIFTV